MSNTEEKKVHIAEVIRHGEQLIIPKAMTIQDAIALLMRQAKYEDETVDIKEDIDCFLWDGALALSKAMARKFGFASAEVIPGGFFRPDQKPQMISVNVEFNRTVLVPWGRFTLPGVEGHIETTYNHKDGKIIFSIKSTVRRKYEEVIRELVSLTREIVKNESIYRGKAIRIRFKDDHGNNEAMPTPFFLDLTRVNEKELIFSEDVQNAIETSIFTPVEQSKKCREYRIPLKRGVLLSGPYGTGKTLAAYVTAKKCDKNNWTFLYCERANELGEMVRFAKQYEPAVIFCEDIDREVEGERTVEMDDILNIVDGIESKNSEIMIILTTNHVEKIAKAMLRPGRLDAVINVLPPDAKAVEKLVRLYGRELIAVEDDLSKVGEVLKGRIPAVIRECVERSKLAAIKRAGDNLSGSMKITADDLHEAALTMKLQLDLLDKEVKLANSNERLGEALKSVIDESVVVQADRIINSI
jgi:transitional endoplasmic reticulum ATPase